MSTKIAFIFFVFLFVGCATTKTGSEQTTIENTETTLFSFTEMLRSKAGVSVQGSGKGAKVRIRSGGHSFLGNSEPLFVVAGQPVNGGLSTVIDLINVQEIKQIRVLKSATEVASYGVRGANGIIEIELK